MCVCGERERECVREREREILLIKINSKILRKERVAFGRLINFRDT